MKLKETYRILLALAVIINWLPATGQDYKEDMQKIRENYKTKYHSYKMKFEFCPYDSLSIVADSMYGKCFMAGSSYYYKFRGGENEYEYIKNAEHYMVIDHGNKVMAVEASSKARAELWDMSKIDSLLAKSAMKVSYKDIGCGEGEYVISFTKGTWNRLTLAFNKEKFTLDRITMYSDEKGTMSGVRFDKPRVLISYTDYSEAAPDNGLFSDSRYLANAGNKTIPTEMYKGYKVLDYLKKN